jgi:hypothetical protein
LIEDEVHHDVKSAATQLQQLTYHPGQVGFKRANFIDGFTALRKLGVGIARNDCQLKSGSATLQCSKQGKRDDHIADAIMPEHQHPFDAVKANRLLAHWVSEHAPEDGIYYPVPERVFD